MNSNLF